VLLMAQVTAENLEKHKNSTDKPAAHALPAATQGVLIK
jgi:hypothetical protein